MAPTPPITPEEQIFALLGATLSTSTIRMCLDQNGYSDLSDFRMLTQQDIDALMVTKDAGDVVQLYRAGRQKLAFLMEWLDLAGAQAGTMLLKISSFETIVSNVKTARVDANNKAKALLATQPVVASSSSSSTYVADLAGNFMKGVKLDESKFPKLEAKTNYVLWKRDTTTTAKMMGLWNVLDDTYTPVGHEETALYDIQQSWMYAAFSKSLCTLATKRIWKEHPDDARAVYLAIISEYETPLKIKYATKHLEDAYKQYKWTAKFNMSLVLFLEKFTEKAADYNEAKVPTLTDDELREQLETAIEDCPQLKTALASVATIERAQLGIGTTTTKLTFTKFYDIIMETAEVADHSWKEKHQTPAPRPQRQANHSRHGAGRGSRRSHTTKLTPHDATRLAEIQKEYGFSAKYYVPPDIFKLLAHPVQEGYKEWRKEQRKKKETRAANMQQHAQGTASIAGSDTSTIATSPDGDWVVMTRASYNAERMAPIPEVVEVTTPNTAPAQAASAAGTVLRQFLSTQAPSNVSVNRTVATATSDPNSPPPRQVTHRGHTYTMSMAKRTYHSRLSDSTPNFGESSTDAGLADGGSSGGMAGHSMLVTATSLFETVDIHGLDNYTMTDIPLGTCACKLKCAKSGETVIAFWNQYACSQDADGYGTGQTIHSVAQLEDFGLTVQDKVTKGETRIIHPDGYEFKMYTQGGLCYVPQARCTLEDFGKYAHVIMTSDMTWDPNKYDTDDMSDDLTIHTSHVEEEDFDDSDIFSVSSEDIQEEAARSRTDLTEFELYVHACVLEAKGDISVNPGGTTVPAKCILPKIVDFELLRPYFGWVPATRVKQTIENTTQFYKAEGRIPMRRHTKARFPGANVPHMPETVASDTLFSDTPALDDGVTGHGGCTMIQIFHGCESGLTEGIPMEKKSEFPKAFADFIRRWGAPEHLFTDGALEECSKAVTDLMRMYCIGRHFRSEPYHQNQNPAERKIQDLKKTTNGIMDRTGSRACEWLLCTLFVIGLFNVLAQEGLKGMTPTQKVTGRIPDVSPYLAFVFRQRVYHSAGPNERTFPGDSSNERTGYWMGPALDRGDILTFWILDELTDQLVPRSEVRTAEDPKTTNERAEATARATLETGEYDAESGTEATATQHVQSINDVIEQLRAVENSAENIPKRTTLRFAPDELKGLTFLHTLADGQKVRAEVVRKIDDINAQNHKDIMMLLKLGDDEAEELMTYTELCDKLDAMMRSDEEKMENGEAFYFFQDIVAHEGPMTNRSLNWKGSKWNVLVRWDDGSETWEPLNVMIAQDPVTCASYAKRNDLVELPGWTSLRKYARRAKVLDRQIKQANMKAHRRAPIYKFGVRVPRDHKEAVQLQEQQGHTKWTDAEAIELKQIDDYDTLRDTGKGTSLPSGYTKIRVAFVYDCKHDGRYKARLVAGGHLTEPDKDNSYSGVVSLKSMRLAMLVGEMNGLHSMVGDIGNAYLESFTKEKVGFIAGPEFGPLEGHTFIIVKALYGLRTSGARFHEKLSDTLRSEGFVPSLADSDLWIRDAGDVYEYVCVYVDDLMAVMKDPAEFFRRLSDVNIHNYKLKGVGPPEYHLGGNFGRDPDGTLWWGSQSYVEKMLKNYERQFGSMPHKKSSPLVDGDHPELDTTDLLDEANKTVYMSMVGAMQWAVTLGRIDLAYSTMVMSRFRVEPRVGHLERLQHVYGYLRKHPDAKIRFRTHYPENDQMFNVTDANWMHSVYGERDVETYTGLPAPKGKMARITTFIDSGLHHCRVTGKASTGMIQFVNQTPVDWGAWKQSTVESSTYGSEYVAAKTGVDKTIDLQFTLKAMGVPVEEPSWMLGDNQSVLTSSNIPHSTMSKRWVALSYHRVRCAIAHGIVRFCHVDTKNNVSDVCTKALGFVALWPFIQPLLFWKGDTNVPLPIGEEDPVLADIGE
mgnify:FL=1